MSTDLSEALEQADEFLSSATFTWDAATGIVVLSQGCGQVLGVAGEAHPTGPSILPGIDPADLPRVQTMFAELTPYKPAGRVSHRVLHPERGAFWVETRGRARFDTAGRMERINGAVEDQTTRIVLETELATAHPLLHLAMAAGKSVGWDWDVRSGRDIWFGDLATVFGIEATTYVGHVDNFRRRVHPEDRGRVWQAVKHAMEGRAPYATEFRLVRSDGSVRWVTAQGRFDFSDDGEPVRMLGIASDITERKDAEDSLHGKDLELAEAQRLAGLGSWRWDVEQDRVTWSDEMYRLAGRDPSHGAVSYADHGLLYTADSWEQLQRAVERALQDGSPYELDLEFVRRDGSIRWVTTRGEAQRDAAGRIVALRGTLQDIHERRKAQEALRESEERMRLATQAARVHASSWDPTAGLITQSVEFWNLLGLSTDKPTVPASDMLTAVHPDDLAKLEATLNNCSPGSPSYRIEYRVIRPDGSVLWLEGIGNALFDRAGELDRTIGVVADVTERRAAEDALQRKDLELAEAQRLAEIGSWQWNLDQRTVTWSDELYRIHGRDPMLPPATFEEVERYYGPDSWERVRRAVDNTMRTGERYELDVEIVRSDGTKRWGVVRGEALRDETGRIVGLRGTVQDVHERRRSEELLRENEQRLRLAAQAGRVYATEWDRASGTITRSEEFTRILGLSGDRRQTTGDDIIATVHPDDREKISAAAYGTTPQDPSYRVQYRVVRPDGSLVWLEASGLALFDRTGTMYRTIGMVADITEHKHAEEAISALTRRLIDAQENERARIARDLHDDIGQRLALALVTLEQQKPAAVKKELRKQLEDIAKSVHNLSHELHAATLRYLGIAKAMRGFCVELAEQKQVDIAFSHRNVPKGVPREVSLCLFRVLQEALHNAVRYSKVSRFEVELLGSSDAVSLTVRDGGIGFDPDRTVKGRGLGLVSMQERLKLVNGRLSIDSQHTRGTTIHARVPLADQMPASVVV